MTQDEFINRQLLAGYVVCPLRTEEWGLTLEHAALNAYPLPPPVIGQLWFDPADAPWAKRRSSDYDDDDESCEVRERFVADWRGVKVTMASSYLLDRGWEYKFYGPDAYAEAWALVERGMP